MCTGTGPVSSGGTSSTAVTSSGAAARRTPHSGQKCAPSGRAASQFGQLTAGMHPWFTLARAAVECPQRLRGLPPERPDQFAVVLVRDLARPVIELELLQGRERTVALLGQLEATALARVGLAEPILGGRKARPPQEGQRDDDHGDDCEHDAERKPDAHATNARPRCASSGFRCRGGTPRRNPVAVLL